MKVLYQTADSTQTSLQRAALLHPDRIKIRIQPGVYQKDSRNYLTWRGVSWTVQVDDAREGEKFRSALAAFFVRLDRVGVDFFLRELEAANRGLPSGQIESLTAEADLG